MIPDPEREVDALRHAFTAGAQQFSDRVPLAESLLYQHESQEAIKVYQVARKLDPNYPDVLLDWVKRTSKSVGMMRELIS